MRKSGKKKQPDAIDEVEELLKLTEEDLLLKLTVDSHIKSKSKSKLDFLPESSSHTNVIDADLDRRLEALKSKSKPKPKPNPKEATTADHEDVDNLFARFAALKAPSKATTTATCNSTTDDVKDDTLGIVDEDEDEDDEVSKIINWAIDAARLDPSPSSDSEEDDEDSEDEASHTFDRKHKPSKK